MVNSRVKEHKELLSWLIKVSKMWATMAYLEPGDPGSCRVHLADLVLLGNFNSQTVKETKENVSTAHTMSHDFRLTTQLGSGVVNYILLVVLVFLFFP